MNEYDSHIGADDIAKFLKFIADDFQRRANPTFDGHRTTYPGQQPMTFRHAVGYGFMATSPKAVYAAVAHETLMTPVNTAAIEASPYGSYHLSASDETYYPFKGIIDLLFD